MIFSYGITDRARNESVMNGAASVEPSSRRRVQVVEAHDHASAGASDMSPAIGSASSARRRRPRRPRCRRRSRRAADGTAPGRRRTCRRRRCCARRVRPSSRTRRGAARSRARGRGRCAGGVVALDHRDLREVALGVGHDGAVVDARRELEVLRPDLILHGPIARTRISLPVERNAPGRQRRDATLSRTQTGAGRRERRGDAVPATTRPSLRPRRAEGDEVVEQDAVGPVARRDRAARQPVAARRVEASSIASSGEMPSATATRPSGRCGPRAAAGRARGRRCRTRSSGP